MREAGEWAQANAPRLDRYVRDKPKDSGGIAEIWRVLPDAALTRPAPQTTCSTVSVRKRESATSLPEPSPARSRS